MNYKVLYRKYRPDGFDNLVGQKHVVDILKNSIKEKRIAKNGDSLFKMDASASIR